MASNSNQSSPSDSPELKALRSLLTNKNLSTSQEIRIETLQDEARDKINGVLAANREVIPAGASLHFMTMDRSKGSEMFPGLSPDEFEKAISAALKVVSDESRISISKIIGDLVQGTKSVIDDPGTSAFGKPETKEEIEKPEEKPEEKPDDKKEEKKDELTEAQKFWRDTGGNLTKAFDPIRKFKKDLKKAPLAELTYRPADTAIKTAKFLWSNTFNIFSKDFFIRKWF